MPQRYSAWLIPVLALGAVGCTDPPDRPPIVETGVHLSYAADDDIGLCPYTVTYAEEWMAAAAEQMGLDASELLPMTYHLVDAVGVEAECGPTDEFAACAWREDDRILMFSSKLLDRHELIHALHQSVWPERQPVLQEGLAYGFDDELPLSISEPAADVIDAALAATTDDEGVSVVGVGAYLVTSIARRHGAAAVSKLWHGSQSPSSAAEFRADFERELGESLDEMLADLDGLSCPIVSCVGEPTPWADDLWTTRSPDGCDDRTIGTVGAEYSVTRTEIMRIDEGGDYEMSVSEGASWGGQIVGCNVDCSFVGPYPIELNETSMYYLPAGDYRVQTVQMSPDDPAYTIEVRRAPGA